jgi:hypothetical protein
MVGGRGRCGRAAVRQREGGVRRGRRRGGAGGGRAAGVGGPERGVRVRPRPTPPGRSPRRGRALSSGGLGTGHAPWTPRGSSSPRRRPRRPRRCRRAARASSPAPARRGRCGAPVTWQTERRGRTCRRSYVCHLGSHNLRVEATGRPAARHLPGGVRPEPRIPKLHATEETAGRSARRFRLTTRAAAPHRAAGPRGRCLRDGVRRRRRTTPASVAVAATMAGAGAELGRRRWRTAGRHRRSPAGHRATLRDAGGLGSTIARRLSGAPRRPPPGRWSGGARRLPRRRPSVRRARADSRPAGTAPTIVAPAALAGRGLRTSAHCVMHHRNRIDRSVARLLRPIHVLPLLFLVFNSTGAAAQVLPGYPLTAEDGAVSEGIAEPPCGRRRDRYRRAVRRRLARRAPALPHGGGP